MGLIEGLKEYLPELGKHLAIDSKKIKRVMQEAKES